MSYFDIKERIDRVLYQSFNLASDIAFEFAPRTKHILSANEAFRGSHAGERCFILGSGPSLGKISAVHIDRLKDEIIFGVNSLYKAPVAKDLTPTYYSLLDNNYWGVSSYTFGEVYERYAHRPPTFITAIRALESLNKFAPKANYIVLHSKHYPVDAMRFDLSRNLSITMNVVGASIQSAIYMGFKKIYLLGCDYNSFCALAASHCYDDSQEIEELPAYNLAFYLKYYHLTTEFHYLLHKLARKMGVQIINATQDSLLDAYPMCQLDSIL